MRDYFTAVQVAYVKLADYLKELQDSNPNIEVQQIVQLDDFNCLVIYKTIA